MAVFGSESNHSVTLRYLHYIKNLFASYEDVKPLIT